MNYGGFYIDKPIGNNEFSYEERKIKKIYVPSLIKSDISEVEISVVPNFIEVEDEKEQICYGLKNMYELELAKTSSFEGKKIYLFDNHNHSFYFWCRELLNESFSKGCTLVHIDQHKDTRVPPNFEVDIEDLEDVKRYVNDVLNVGSFIKPALYHNIFSELRIIDSKYGMEEEFPKNEYVLDLDLDFFSKDMDYIDFDERIVIVKKYIGCAKVITIATSPFFIEQERALEVLKILLNMEK